MKINVTCSSMPPIDEYINEIAPLWKSRWLTNMGEKHKEFTDKLQEFLQVDHLSLMANGHMSLELTLQALGIKGEVITTPFTFVSTTHAIVRNGLEPVFCDITPEDFTIDVNQIEKLITPRTAAILPVHVYGNICNVEEIQRIARRHGLYVVYDAAHAFGETKNGESIAGYGHASIFSFHATKVFHTVEGGAVVFHDEEVGKKLYNLKNFGIHNAERVDSVGANAKMNEFQAAMGLCNLRHIGEEIQKRKRIYEHYVGRLDGIHGIRYRKIQKNVQSNYAYFPIFIDWTEFKSSRNEIYDRLRENDIYPRKYFYPLTSEFECYSSRFDASMTPVAQKISRQALALPIYADLAEEDVDRICDLILE